MRFITESAVALDLDYLAHGTPRLQINYLPQPISAPDEYSFQYRQFLILKTVEGIREKLNAIEEIRRQLIWPECLRKSEKKK